MLNYNFVFYFLAQNVFRPILEVQQDGASCPENASSFNNRAQQRRKVSDSSAESNTNKFINSPDDLPLNRNDTGSNLTRSAYSMMSTTSGQTTTGPPKLSHRTQPSSSQEVNSLLHYLN